MTIIYSLHLFVRHSMITFLSLGLDGHWRLHALPFLCPDNSNILGSGAQAKIGDCILVSAPVDSFRVDQHKERMVSLSDASCSVKSLTDLSFSQSKVHHQSRSKSLTAKAISLENLSECAAGMISDDSVAINSFEASIDCSKEQKNAKKNARRNARKKAKRKSKLSSYIGSTDLEVLSKECTLGSSTSEACINNDIIHGDGTVLGDSTPVNSLLDSLISVSDSIGDSNGMNNCLETSQTCTSYIDGMDKAEYTITSVIHNFGDEHSVINSEDGIQTKDMGFSISKGLEDNNGETIHSCDNMSFKCFSDVADSFVLSSVPDGYSCEDSTNAGSDNCICAGYNASPSNEEDNGMRDSETYQSNRNECFAHQSAKNSSVDSCNSADHMKLHSIGCSSSDTQLNVHGQRDKQTKMVVENAHGFVGKENANLQPDKTSKEALLLKRNCNNIEASMASKSEDKNRRKVKVQRKSKKKKNPGSNQDYHCYSKKTSHSMKASSDAPARINIEENEISVFPVLLNGQNGTGNVPPSCSQNYFAEPELQIKGVESMTPELVHRLQDCTSSLEPPERHGTICNIKDHFTKSLNNLGMSNLHERQSAVHLHPFIDEEVAQADKNISLRENGKQEHSSALVMKKWRPVVRKDSDFASLNRSDISLLPHADGLTDEGWTPNNSVEETLSSNSHKPVSSNESKIMCVDHSSGNANCLYPRNKSPVQNTCMPKNHFSVDCFAQACKEKHIFAFGADSSKISGALHDVHRVQQLSESVQLATGSPSADFERLLHAASPVICHSNNNKICQNCLQGEIDGPLCQREAPNITLKSLWKWYKKHGNYGLEVRLEDCECSKRLCSHRSAFQAYFVPSLSAVQLFKRCKSHCVNNGPAISKACGMSKISQSSCGIGYHPLFSIPVPRPDTEDTSLSPLRNLMRSSQVSSTAQSVDTTITDDSELLFEYFESDQPQLRKPLFEK